MIYSFETMILGIKISLLFLYVVQQHNTSTAENSKTLHCATKSLGSWWKLCEIWWQYALLFSKQSSQTHFTNVYELIIQLVKFVLLLHKNNYLIRSWNLAHSLITQLKWHANLWPHWTIWIFMNFNHDFTNNLWLKCVIRLHRYQSHKLFNHLAIE